MKTFECSICGTDVPVGHDDTIPIDAVCTRCQTLGDMVLQCPTCDSPDAVYLGDLGRLVWYRCRDCGIDYNVHVDHEPTVERFKEQQYRRYIDKHCTSAG